jgi:hypothetical protein
MVTLKRILIFMILGALVFSGCTDQKKKPTDALSICEITGDLDKCYLNIAVHNKDEAPCKRISSPEDRDFCYLYAMQQTGTPSTCNLIANQSARDYCWDKAMVFTTITESSLCERITDRRIYARCQAMAKNEPSICMDIDDKTAKENCFYRLAELSNWSCQECCDNVTNPASRDLCYSYSAEAKNDSSICQKIFDSNAKSNCISVLESDITYCKSYCKSIEMAHNIADSYENLSKSECHRKCIIYIPPPFNPSTYLSDCVKTGKPGSICKKQLLLVTQNDSLCEDAGCFADIAKIKKDMSVCENAHNAQRTDFCYTHLAMDSYNDSICDRILNQTEKEICKATANRDTKKFIAFYKCDEQPDQNKKDDCYEGAIRHTGQVLEGKLSTEDIYICDLIADRGKKENCYDSLIEGVARKEYFNRIGYSPNLFS